MSTPLEPENWLTYKGDRRGSVGQLMGPNTVGEIATVVAAEFDATANKTKLGLVTGDVRSEIAAVA
jgi:hypothetical protein